MAVYDAETVVGIAVEKAAANPQKIVFFLRFKRQTRCDAGMNEQIAARLMPQGQRTQPRDAFLAKRRSESARVGTAETH